MGVTDPPLSRDRLNHARLRLRKSVPMQGVGSHLRRRAGQSLEFRDYRDYQFGDDIRLVDWRASARSGPARDWVLKIFEAEERMSLMILVDDRAAMRLPEGAEKLLYALWALRALAEVAGASGDAIVLARMFTPDAPVITATGRGCAGAARSFAEDVWAAPSGQLADVPRCDLAALRRHLQPASAVVILSDLLFEDPEDKIAGFLQEAQKSWRQVIVQPLESAAFELMQLQQEAGVKVADTEGRQFDNAVFETNTTFEEEIRNRLTEQVSHHVARWRGPGLVVEEAVLWPRSLGEAGLDHVFKETFLSGGLFSGIAARGGLR